VLTLVETRFLMGPESRRLNHPPEPIEALCSR
jgi:hypothetical protein